MRFISIKNLKSGMEIARSIYGHRGELVLRQGNFLRPGHIRALRGMGYPGVYIKDALSEGIEKNVIIEETVRHEAISAAKDVFKAAADNQLVRSQHMIEGISGLLLEMVEQILSDDKTVINMPLFRTFDDYTYRHSVDTSVLALILGKAMNMPKEQLLDLGKSAFFHDMGKMFVPKTIINKPEKLTRDEYAVMKTHASLGYDFTRDVLSQNSSINGGVLYHHEKFDGSGYPHSISGENIPLFARLVAVADVFDAITSCRPYSQAKIASEAYEYIIGNAGCHFDPDIVDIFCRTVAPFPVGITVVLSNGLHGLVVKNYENFMNRPLVRAFEPDNPDTFEYIDLAFDASALNITIVSTE